MLNEFEPRSKSVQAKCFPKGEKYYYVFFIGTRKDSRGKGRPPDFDERNTSLCSSGLSSSLIRHYQTIAASKGLPIWLEATTPYSQKLYAGLGFETIDEIVLGKGKAAADGITMKGGEGVRIWGMVWRPKV